MTKACKCTGLNSLKRVGITKKLLVGGWCKGTVLVKSTVDSSMEITALLASSLLISPNGRQLLAVPAEKMSLCHLLSRFYNV